MAKQTINTKSVKKAPAAPLASVKPSANKSSNSMNSKSVDKNSAAQSPSSEIPTLSVQKEDFNPAAAVKGYRSNPDMENFFRFIYENDLRQEALGILDLILAERQEKRMKKV